MSSYPMTATQFGFQWGPAKVIRICDNPPHGVWMQIEGERERLVIRVTQGGRIKISDIVKLKPTPPKRGKKGKKK